MINSKFIEEYTIIDPDTKLKVSIGIYKLDTGGIVGIDSSFLELGENVYSPFDRGIKLKLD
jgi:hypothetical protein